MKQLSYTEQAEMERKNMNFKYDCTCDYCGKIARLLPEYIASDMKRAVCMTKLCSNPYR